MNKYKLRNYNPKFLKFFEREREILRGFLPKAKIEHVGSTAVSGLKGKGIIDIIIAVPKRQIGNAKEILKQKNYIFKPKAGDKDRLFFERDYRKLFRKRRVHLHLTNINSKAWKNCIKIRDKLRKSSELRKEYE